MSLQFKPRRGFIFFAGAFIALCGWIVSQLISKEWLKHTIHYIKELPDMQSLIVFFAGAIAETLFPICHYVPGTMIVFTLLAAKANSMPAYAFVIPSAMGVLTGALINYLFGYYLSIYVSKNSSVLKFVEKLSIKYGIIADIITAVHPNNLGALYILYGINRSNIVGHIFVSIGTTVLFAYIVFIFSETLIPDPEIFSSGHIQLYIFVVLTFVGLIRSIGIDAYFLGKSDV